MKKVFAFILVLCMVLSCMPAMADGGCTCTEGTFTYTANTGNKAGTHWFKCNDAECGKWRTIEGKTEENCTYEYVSVGADGHKEVCSKCGYEKPNSTVAHTLSWTNDRENVDHSQTCSICGYDAKKWEACYDDDGYLAGSNGKGKLDYHGTRTCKVCNEPFEGANKNDHEWVVAKDGESRTCSLCDKTEDIDCAHENLTTYEGQAATCTKDGKTAGIYCFDCGNWLQKIETIKAGHTWDKGVVDTPATCYKPGSKLFTCTECGTTKYETIEIADGHEYVLIDKKAATCSEAGYEKYECSICKTPYTKVIKATDVHTYSKTVFGSKVAGDFTEEVDCTKGVYTRTVCKDCGAILDGSEKKICEEETTHNFTIATTITATCTTKGGTTYKCSNRYCTKHDETGLAYIDGANGTHIGDAKKVVVKAATCTTDGAYYYVCTKCGAKVDAAKNDTTKNITETKLVHTNDGDKPAHSGTHEDVKDEDGVIIWTYVEPTCKDYGYWTSNCDRCGNNARTSYLEDCVACTPSASHHQYEKVTVVEPTCTVGGYAKNICKICNAVETEEVDGKDVEKMYDVAAGHDYQLDGEPFKAATCAEVGQGYFKCTRCGDRKLDTIPATGKHNYQKMTKAATCLEDARTGTYCTVCGAKKEGTREEIVTGSSKGQHTLTNVEIVRLCDEHGVTYGKKLSCAYCDFHAYKTMNDAWYTHTGSVGKWIVEKTCTVDGIYESGACPKCDYITNSSTQTLHQAEHLNTVRCTDDDTEANCVENKTECYYCDACDTHFSKEVKGTKDANKHKAEYIDWIVENTCTEPGYGYKGCTACGYKEKTASEIAAAHKYTVKEIVLEPTCAKKGYYKLSCSVCGAEENELHEIAATVKHVYGRVELNSENCAENSYVLWGCTECYAKDPDAAKKGYIYKEGTYTWDGETLESVINVKAAGTHDFGDAYLVEAPTCTKAVGSYHKCKVCGVEELFKQTGANALGHDWLTDKDAIVVEDTCFKAGYSYELCARCGEVQNYKEGELEEHDLQQVADREVKSTCSTLGYDVYKCTVCGYEKIVPKTEYVASNHEYITIKEIHAANCKTGEYGFAYQQCRYCEDTAKVRYFAPEHNWEVKEVLIEATCSNAGSVVKKCTVCGKTTTVSTEKLEHNLVTKKVEATCEKPAGIETRCSECGFEYSFVRTGVAQGLGHIMSEREFVKSTDCTKNNYYETRCLRDGCTFTLKTEIANTAVATAHKNELVETVKSTCVANGYKLYRCTVCGTETEEALAADTTAHKWVITNTHSEPTCTTYGIVDRKCDLCGAEETYHSMKLEHEMSDYVVTDEVIYKFCYKCGYIESNYVAPSFKNFTGCTTVKFEHDDETGKYVKVIEGSHKGLVVNASKDATCTEKGELGHIECTVCGTVIQQGGEIPAHKTEDVAAKAATCTEAGYTAGVYCTECKKYISGHEEIAATGHKWVDVPAQDATATKPGYTAGVQCENCKEWKEGHEETPVKAASLKRTAVLRKTAELLGERAALLSTDDAITITGELVNGFYPVSTANGTGYIHNSYIAVA